MTAGAGGEPRPLIVADVGGTHVRLAVAVPQRDGRMAELQHYRRSHGVDHPGLESLLRDYAADVGIDGSDAGAAIAVAGVLRGDVLLHANLPWPVLLSRLRRETGLQDLAVVNDFEALAWAIPAIDPLETTLVCGPAGGIDPGPALIIGPGTGLGAAVLYPRPSPFVVATEVGHAALAAGSERELELVRELLRDRPCVDNERVLSGPGLLNAYGALCRLAGMPPRSTTPAEVTAAACDGGDRQAVEALDIFCAMLGSLAGDLAVTFGARSVHLAGGIPVRIARFLQASRFAERFRNKGVMGEVLAQVPVRLVDHGRLALHGAALWYWGQGERA